MCYANISHKKAGEAILIQDKGDFKIRRINETKRNVL